MKSRTRSSEEGVSLKKKISKTKRERERERETKKKEPLLSIGGEQSKCCSHFLHSSLLIQVMRTDETLPQSYSHSWPSRSHPNSVLVSSVNKKERGRGEGGGFVAHVDVTNWSHFHFFWPKVNVFSLSLNDANKLVLIVNSVVAYRVRKRGEGEWGGGGGRNVKSCVFIRFFSVWPSAADVAIKLAPPSE